MTIEIEWRCPQECWTDGGQCHVRLGLHHSVGAIVVKGEHDISGRLGPSGNGKETVKVEQADAIGKYRDNLCVQSVRQI